MERRRMKLGSVRARVVLPAGDLSQRKASVCVTGMNVCATRVGLQQTARQSATETAHRCVPSRGLIVSDKRGERATVLGCGLPHWQQ
jgi:hypothetical protein